MKQVLVRDTVDIYLIDDTATGARMSRNQTPTLQAAGVRCRVNEQAPKSIEAGSAELVAHSHRVQFWSYQSLTTNHQIWWTNPEGGGVIKMRVVGTKTRPSKAMPYVVYCQAFQAGS